MIEQTAVRFPYPK